MLCDAIAGPIDPVPPVIACTLKDGLDVLWVHVAGGLEMATAPQLEQALRQWQQQRAAGRVRRAGADVPLPSLRSADVIDLRLWISFGIREPAVLLGRG